MKTLFMAASTLVASYASHGGIDKPNIIFILIDDLGWAELGCYGNTFNETPNLDKLADAGMRFTDAYAAAPVCSPYRAALLTGQYPARIGITDYLRPDTDMHLPADCATLPRLLQAGGYATGIIGKWHLSGYQDGQVKFGPEKYGFDEVILSEKTDIGGGSYFHPYTCVDATVPKKLAGDTEYLPDRLNVEAIEFIERHRDRPFFLYLSHYAVHTRLQGKPEHVARFESKPGAGQGNRAKRNNPHLAAQLQAIDEGVGMIVRKLDELGIAGNTILVFTGDNGGEDRVTSNGPFRAGKSTLYEGGIRVPLIIRWPGTVKPGSLCRTPTANMDFLPTFARIGGARIEPRHAVDGVSILPLLCGGEALKREALYWHYPLKDPHFLGGRSGGAVRQGNWKLIEWYDDGSRELFNLRADPGEQNNLAAKHPDKVAELASKLAVWRKDVGAPMPD